MNSLSGRVLWMQILQASIGFFFVYLWVITDSSSVDGQLIKRSQWGWSLENASYHQMEAKDYPTCLVNCITDKRCRSLTYDLLGKKCKLSGETRWSKPLQYIGNISNSIYMEMILTADRMQQITPGIAVTSEPLTTPQTTSEPPTTTEPSTTTEPPTTTESPTTPEPPTTTKPPNTTKPPTTPEPPTTTKPPKTTKPPTTTEPPTTFDSSKYCIGKASGDYLHPTDCKQYITCSNGYTHERSCNNVVGPVCPAGC